MKTERLLPIGVAGIGGILTGIGVTAATGVVLEAGAVIAGIALFGAGYWWYHRQWERADEVRIDERLRQVAERSGELSFRVSLALAMGLFLAIEADSVPVTASDGLVLLIVGMVVARFGLYGWVRRQSV